MKIRTYLAQVSDGMAKGLFASLIIGTIITQIGVYTGFMPLENFGRVAQYLMGPAIGAGVALSRKASTFTLLAAITAGAIGAGTLTLTDGVWAAGIGEPVGAFIAALCGTELGKLIEGHTKFDLLLVPAAVILVASVLGAFVSPVIKDFMTFVGGQINRLTELHPLPYGILLGIIIGMILTLPVSSAALCIAIQIGGLAGGAACAGCCAQMVGFAVMSFRENKWGGLLAQGLGTSMLQVPNIIKNPLIWIPPTIASGVCGLLSTMVFKMETDMVGAGMGTSGLVGPFRTLSVMGNGIEVILKIVTLQLIIPALISLVLCELMRKKGFIRQGDLKI
ncbi:MAG: PTS sugar transporter subunit IIC [Clostridiales bacterium]|jgi:uncharacterized membrane protein|nr:PTS sugar transporter subunit IIC [Clostridiales bacterium]